MYLTIRVTSELARLSMERLPVIWPMMLHYSQRLFWQPRLDRDAWGLAVHGQSHSQR